MVQRVFLWWRTKDNGGIVKMGEGKMLTKIEILLSFFVLIPLIVVMMLCQFEFMVILFAALIFFLSILGILYQMKKNKGSKINNQ